MVAQLHRHLQEIGTVAPAPRDEGRREAAGEANDAHRHGEHAEIRGQATRLRAQDSQRRGTRAARCLARCALDAANHALSAARRLQHCRPQARAEASSWEANEAAIPLLEARSLDDGGPEARADTSAVLPPAFPHVSWKCRAGEVGSRCPPSYTQRRWTPAGRRKPSCTCATHADAHVCEHALKHGFVLHLLPPRLPSGLDTFRSPLQEHGSDPPAGAES